MTPDWMPRIDQEKCTACGDCIAVCPTGALGWLADKVALLHPAHCAYCGVCEDVCPASAIELPYLIVKDESKVSEEP